MSSREAHRAGADRHRQTVLVDQRGEDSTALAAYLERQGANVRVAPGGAVGPGLDGVAAVYIDPVTKPEDPLVLAARQQGITTSNLAEVVLTDAPGPTVGITGTAGKTTTTLLLAEVLRAAGIETAASTDSRLTASGPDGAMLTRLEALEPGGWTVVELGSRLLDHMTTSPDIAVVTNLFPDHQAWHGSFDAYQKAKESILVHQDDADLAVLNHDDAVVRKDFSRRARGSVHYFSLHDGLDRGVVVSAGALVVRRPQSEQLICALDDLRLPRHQLGAALAATTVALAADAPIHAVRDGLRSFIGAAHRGSLAGTVKGVEIYDDSLAMNPRKALAGLSALAEASITLVAGGSEVSTRTGERRIATEVEQEDLRRFCTEAARKAARIVLFGDGGERIASLLPAGPVVTLVPDFASAITHAVEGGVAGDRVLISPVFHSPPEDIVRTLRTMLDPPAGSTPPR